jgi:hypothetical protein
MRPRFGPAKFVSIALLLLPHHRRASCDGSSRNGTGRDRHAFCHPFTALSFRIPSEFATPPLGIRCRCGGFAGRDSTVPRAVPPAPQKRRSSVVECRAPVHAGTFLAATDNIYRGFDRFPDRCARVHSHRVQSDRDQPIVDRPVYTLWCDHVIASGFLPRLRLRPAGKAGLENRIPGLMTDRISPV